MDTKSLAKSKRAHSQHHSRGRRPNQPRQTLAAKSLHTNWDRYAEEDEAESETALHSADSVPPKSKGADFRYLVAEAQAQASNHLPSLDDELTAEFSQAFGSMLSIKGDGILAWSADDNFVVDNESTAHPESRYLSLNLHVLAEELGKIELSQRLFMDADLLPPELRTGVSEASRDRTPYQMAAADSSVEIKQRTKDLTAPDVPVQGDNTNQPFKATTGLGSSAEAELDVLLNSFNEIEILGSPGSRSAGRNETSGAVTSSYLDGDDLDSLLNETAVSIGHRDLIPPDNNNFVQNERPSTLTSSQLDDDLDSLLSEASASTSHRELLRPEKGTFVQPTLGTKPLDDFDLFFDTL